MNTLSQLAGQVFDEMAEGSSYNKYFELYNPTKDAIDLAEYAYPTVSNAPTVVGEHTSCTANLCLSSASPLCAESVLNQNAHTFVNHPLD